MDQYPIEDCPIWDHLIELDPYCLRRMWNPSDRLKLLAVSINGWVVEHIENPTPEMQMIAVQNSPHCANYIKNPCLFVQLMRDL